jgi:hypothetical protein
MDRLNPGDRLNQGQSIVSPDGRYSLTVEADGNVVLSEAGSLVRWSSQTTGNPGASLAMQADGNLVLYSPGSTALWSSGTWGHPGAWVVMQADGNLVVYAATSQAVLWATDTWRTTRQVDGFVPSTSGLPFRNDYPTGTKWPILDLPVVGGLLTADAASGLCGGFGFTVVDMFLSQPKLELPRDTPRPPDPSPRFQYIYHRLLDSFNGVLPYATILKLLDWIETPDHDDLLRHGLGHMMATDEWPNIKTDIDSNRPSPIVLVGSPQGALGDIESLKKALADSHQVVAYGYDLGPSDVTIHVYDPNNPSEDNATLTVPLTYAERPILTANMGREVRGLFRSHYAWHDPRPTWG